MRRMKLLIAMVAILTTNFELVSPAKARHQGEATIKGRIVDLFGFPLKSVKVEVAVERSAQELVTFSDDQGYYEVNNVPITQFFVIVSCTGFVTERLSAKISKGTEAHLDFGLVASYMGNSIPIEISGRIRWLGDGPIENASVTIVNAFNRNLAYSVSTQRNGYYRALVDYPGQYIISASKPGFAVKTVALVLSASLPRVPRTAELALSTLQAHQAHKP